MVIFLGFASTSLSRRCPSLVHLRSEGHSFFPSSSSSRLLQSRLCAAGGARFSRPLSDAPGCISFRNLHEKITAGGARPKERERERVFLVNQPQTRQLGTRHFRERTPTNGALRSARSLRYPKNEIVIFRMHVSTRSIAS